MISQNDVQAFDAVSLRDAVAKGSVSAVEVTQAFLRRIETHGRTLGAFLYVDAEGALAAAESIDCKRKNNQDIGLLGGVPIAVKDNICMRGLPTTCASKILEGYVPPYDAHVVEKLREAGAVIVGKTNLDEFAMGSSTENSAYFPAKNPWDTSRAPGGSSGGSATATAASLAVASLGSDTGGSVRQPGAFCGLTALKPTYGRISRYGLVAFASSLDQIGPITWTVRDSARLLQVMAGLDERDATTVSVPVENYEAQCNQSIAALRVGVVRNAMSQVTDVDVKDAFSRSIELLKKLGATLVDVDLPHADYAVSAYYLIAPAEASSNLARFDGVRYGLRVDGKDLQDTYSKTRGQGFGPEVKRRIMLGTYALSAGYYDAFYVRAQKVRTLIRQDYDKAFEQCDVVLTPTAPTPAFKLGEKVSDPVAMYLADIFTLPPSLAGIPAISVPCGFSGAGLPLGIQFAAKAFAESTLIRVSDAFEKAVEVIHRRPTLS